MRMNIVRIVPARDKGKPRFVLTPGLIDLIDIENVLRVEGKFNPMTKEEISSIRIIDLSGGEFNDSNPEFGAFCEAIYSMGKVNVIPESSMGETFRCRLFSRLDTSVHENGQIVTHVWDTLKEPIAPDSDWGKLIGEERSSSSVSLARRMVEIESSYRVRNIYCEEVGTVPGTAA